MAHFAKIENGIVVDVVVVANEFETDGQDYLNSLGLTGTWVQTSYNANFGKKFAAIGDTYNNKTKEFKPAKPFDSWTWNATEWAWKAPVVYPNDNQAYYWNETERNWTAI